MNDTLLSALRALVACDSRNPPRQSAQVAQVAKGLLSVRLDVSVTDLGEGSINIFATRGTPRVLLTAHLDTVPLAAGWTRDPFALTIENGRAYGLGACDIKGGAAAMIVASLELDEDVPVAVLFTTDEEGGSASCIRTFLGEKHAFDLVVVAEPTGCFAVQGHRGIGTGTLQFSGRGAHSSVPGASVHSAIHHMMRWGSEALSLDQQLDRSLEGGNVTGTRFNVGRIAGGEKTNMIADNASARFGVRPPPGTDPREILREFAVLAKDATYVENFIGPALPAAGTSEKTIRAAKKHARDAGAFEGKTVDFWTEASLFSAAGYATFVLGPGDILQAHAADEFVELAQLDRALELYRALLRGGST